MTTLPQEEESATKKRNRIKKLSPKTHQVKHEFGRSTKDLWRQIIERSRKNRSS